MRDMKPSLIARVTAGLYYNPTVTWLRKTVSRYSGAFSIIVQMYAEYLMNKFLSISEKTLRYVQALACRQSRLVGLSLRQWVQWDGVGARASFPVSL